MMAAFPPAHRRCCLDKPGFRPTAPAPVLAGSGVGTRATWRSGPLALTGSRLQEPQGKREQPPDEEPITARSVQDIEVFCRSISSMNRHDGARARLVQRGLRT
jgi:hypothetical protein